VFLISFCKSHPQFTLDKVALVTLSRFTIRFTISRRCCTLKVHNFQAMLYASRFTISRLCCTLKFVFPAGTSSRHAAVPPSRDKGEFTLPTSDPPKDGFAACSRMLFGVTNRRPEFIRPGRRGDRGGTSEKRGRFRGFTVKQRKRARAFTLLELLVVMGIIVLLLAGLVPAVTSLSKSNGRKAAIASLLGGIEQARAEAIKSGQATYVVFPTFASGAQSTLDRYNYRSYAIFEDDAASPGNVKQLSGWKSFPTGVALRAAGTAALSNLADPGALTPPAAFSFAPDASAAPLKCFKFNSNGEIQAPAANVLLGVFEGYVANGGEVATTKDGSGNPSAVEYLMVSQFTGRAEPTASPTATP